MVACFDSLESGHLRRLEGVKVIFRTSDDQVHSPAAFRGVSVSDVLVVLVICQTGDASGLVGVKVGDLLDEHVNLEQCLRGPSPAIAGAGLEEILGGLKFGPRLIDELRCLDVSVRGWLLLGVLGRTARQEK